MKQDHHKGMGRPEGPEHHGRGHGRGGRGPGGHGRGRDAERLFSYGELRLLVLSLIADKPRHGYELIKEITALYGGAYSPSPGVLYPTLSWLEDMGYITIEAAEGGRKLSRLSPEGTAFLEANRAAVEELLQREPPQGRPADVPKAVLEAMGRLKGALRSRLATGPADAGEIARIAATLDAAAEAIAGPAAPQD